MNTTPEITVQKFALASRRVIITFLVCFFISAVILMAMVYLEIKWTWLGIFAGALLVKAFLLLAVSWITPVALMFFRTPELMFAWLRGMNFISAPTKPWTQLSNGERTAAYFASVLLFALTLCSVVALIF